MGNKIAGQTIDSRFTIACRVIDAREKPLAGLRIRLYDQDPRSFSDPLGEPGTTDEDGMVVFRFKYSDFTEDPGEGGPDLYFKIWRNETALDYVVLGVRNDKGVIRNYRPRPEPVILRVDKHCVVTGVVIQANGLPAEKLELFLDHLAFGGERILLGSTVTNAQGHYELTYDPGPGPVNLEIRARDVNNPGQTIPLVKTRFAASAYEVLNLVAPAAPQAAEYRRLAADFASHISRTAKLADVREDAERWDLTVLNRTTGWNARLLALAAVAERLSADKDVNLSPEAVYSLLRAGLPSEKILLAHVKPEVAEQALRIARDAGIVGLTDQEIAGFKTDFQKFAAEVRLNIPAPGSHSTYGELLDASGVFAQTAQGKQVRDRFLEIFLYHRGDAAELWTKARQAGLNEEQIRTLKLQGKLAFLTGNSGAMTKCLLGKQINGKPITDPEQLVELDFYHTEAWIMEIMAQAGIPANRLAKLTATDKKALEKIIPAVYTAEKIEDRLQAYAGDMACRIRMSYPTQVVARRLETDSAFKLPEANQATVTLLRRAAKQGFRLGVTPTAAFLRSHPDLLKDIPASEAQTAQKQLQMLQRIYQITPNDEAMAVLLRLGLTSAYDITAHSKESFTRLFNEESRNLFKAPLAPGLAAVIYHKAEQVISVTCNLFSIAKTMTSQPPVAVLSPPAQERESIRDELIKRFPTMESLFGSTDFLESEHSCSVLGPAAYLVDLLQFIDPDETVWSNFLAHWKATHNGNDYPHKDKSGKPMKPYDVLVERRPDLPHIPLTSENTDTALPYIDIVNEILEYFVAHGKLGEKAAYDTGDAETADLLAEPQNVIREAYDKLCEARYPLNLPFDLWLETARRFCAYFETPLAHVLETFRPGDELFAPTQPYERAAIFLESLGLSPTETELFTDPDPLTNSKWHELYGFPANIPLWNPATTGQGQARQATLTVSNADAGKLREGQAFSYCRKSTPQTLSPDSLRIYSIGAPDSGGAGQTRITMDGEWSSPPQAGDWLVCREPEALRSAKFLARRLGLTYRELAAIVQTGFVNPEMPKLVLLYKLGVSVADARLYKDYRPFYEQNKDLIGKNRNALSPADQQRFDNLAEKVPPTNKTGWEILNEIAAFERPLTELAAKFNTSAEQLRKDICDIPFDQVLVLADPGGGGNFDLTTLQYADGTDADPVVFLRINLFVRLWRKLGWSIEELDRALTVFLPSATPFVPEHLAPTAAENRPDLPGTPKNAGREGRRRPRGPPQTAHPLVTDGYHR